DRALLNKLDAYEGFEPGRPRQSLFVRKRTSILRPKQSPLTGCVYEYNGDVKSFPIIKNGRYPKVSPRPSYQCGISLKSKKGQKTLFVAPGSKSFPTPAPPTSHRFFSIVSMRSRLRAFFATIRPSALITAPM